MNLGYVKDTDTELNHQVCPICGDDIYVYKSRDDFKCFNNNCLLGLGAKEFSEKVTKIINMIN